MIAPLMTSIFSDGLRSVRPGWIEGSLALGVNRWRTTWKIAVRTRPAGDRRRHRAGDRPGDRRGGDARRWSPARSGSPRTRPTASIFLYEPSRSLAPTIIKNIDSLGSEPAKATLFAIASVLLFSAAFFSLAGWVARRSMRKYGTAH